MHFAPNVISPRHSDNSVKHKIDFKHDFSYGQIQRQILKRRVMIATDCLLELIKAMMCEISPTDNESTLYLLNSYFYPTHISLHFNSISVCDVVSAIALDVCFALVQLLLSVEFHALYLKFGSNDFFVHSKASQRGTKRFVSIVDKNTQEYAFHSISEYSQRKMLEFACRLNCTQTCKNYHNLPCKRSVRRAFSALANTKQTNKQSLRCRMENRFFSPKNRHEWRREREWQEAKKHIKIILRCE